MNREVTIAEVGELEMENELLRERLAALPEMLDGLRWAIAAMFMPRERRRPEGLVAVQALATCAGLPQRCESRECRREGRCCATDAADPKCRDHWSPALRQQLGIMAAGIELAALFRDREDAARSEEIARLLGVGVADKPGAKPPRHEQAGRRRAAKPRSTPLKRAL